MLELRAELEQRGARFRTRCDTEVLLHLYLRDGPQLRLPAARDVRHRAVGPAHAAAPPGARPFGIKPLYYALDDGHISFASELKALLRQPGFSREVDPDALQAYLAFNSIPAPLTIFRGGAQAPRWARAHLLCARRARSNATRAPRPSPAQRCRDGARG